jgi:hypothetical protein
MMKNLFHKLRSKAGESLIESLAAILIFTMASIVMYSMVTTAADINRTAKIMDETNQQHMIAVEKGLPEAQNGSATITFSLDGTQIAQTQVDIYGGKDGSLFTYFVNAGG